MKNYQNTNINTYTLKSVGNNEETFHIAKLSQSIDFKNLPGPLIMERQVQAEISKTPITRHNTFNLTKQEPKVNKYK